MIQWRRLLLWLALIPACTSVPGPAPETPAPAQTSQSAKPKPSLQESEALQRLRRSVEFLSDSVENDPQLEVARALRELANALELLPQTEDQAVDTIREIAMRLESSPREGPSLTEDIDMSLSAARQALITRPVPMDRQLDYEGSIFVLTRSIQQLKSAQPLTGQRKEVASAFRAATDAIFLARAAEPPFGEAEAAGISFQRLKGLDAELEEARSEVLRLAETSAPNVRTALANALLALAEVIAAGDGGGQCSRQISDIRLQVERLYSTDVLTFGQAKWAKTALTAALDALDALYANGNPAVLEWARAARRAVAGIEEEQSLTFQRAAIQDGLRATLDAFAFAVTANSR